MGVLFGLILILWVLCGVRFGSGVCFGVDFGRWGRRFGLAGKGTVAQSGCQEAFGRLTRFQIRIAGCHHKGREQQASEVQIRPPASNPKSRLRSQGLPAAAKRRESRQSALARMCKCEFLTRNPCGIYSTWCGQRRRKDTHHDGWLGPGHRGGMGAARGNIWRRDLRANRPADLVPYALLHSSEPSCGGLPTLRECRRALRT